jgi:N-acetylmuramoyl-L-alanine amidase
MRKINKIIVHCTATQRDHNVTVKDLRKWHVNERGWSDIGYHFFIDLKGEVHECRPIEKTGAHSKGQNFDSIGVAYAGGLGSDNAWHDTRTEEQKLSLEELLCYLKVLYSKATIYGHRDFSEKMCPSFDAREEYEWISNQF